MSRFVSVVTCALVGFWTFGLTATSFYLISQTSYDYAHVVGGFAILGGTLGGFVGLVQEDV